VDYVLASTCVILHVRGVFLPEEAVRDAWVVDGRLTFERPVGAAEAETVVSSGWMIPGLVDAHCHVGISPQGHVRSHDGQAAQARQSRDAGALLLRDAGSPVDTSWIQQRDDLPRLIRAGRHIARTRRYIRDQGVEVEPEGLAGEVERQVRNSDGWVKIAADWIDRDVGDLRPTFPVGALTAAVERAHALGARVAVHVFGEQALSEAIEAGVDSIEHATGLTDAALDRLSDTGIVIVPTLINTDQFHAIARRAEAKYPRYAQHMRDLFASSRTRVRAAWEAGVDVYVGTDAGVLPHGLVRHEIAALAGAGLPLEYVLGQASWRAREWLGLPGLVEGAPADLVAYDTDPRTDLSVVYDPRRVLLRGQVVQ
jgi:imidazolonepropionase-like amidohydrolase